MSNRGLLIGLLLGLAVGLEVGWALTRWSTEPETWRALAEECVASYEATVKGWGAGPGVGTYTLTAGPRAAQINGSPAQEAPQARRGVPLDRPRTPSRESPTAQG